MTHSKLFSIVALVAFSALPAVGGCAFETTPGSDETDQSQSDLKKASAQGLESPRTPDPTTPGGAAFQPKPLKIVNTIKTDHLLGAGGGGDEGPRPHPWQPAPESENDGTNSGSSAGGSSGKSAQ